MHRQRLGGGFVAGRVVGVDREGLGALAQPGEQGDCFAALDFLLAGAFGGPFAGAGVEGPGPVAKNGRRQRDGDFGDPRAGDFGAVVGSRVVDF